MKNKYKYTTVGKIDHISTFTNIKWVSEEFVYSELKKKRKEKKHRSIPNMQPLIFIFWILSYGIIFEFSASKIGRFSSQRLDKYVINLNVMAAGKYIV